jgi:DNA-binding transcriptional regulator YiaG
MDNDTEWEWKGKYKSELFMVIHQGAQGLYEVGAISDKEMKEYDRGCLVSPPRKARKSKGATVAQNPVPVYAAPAK